MRIILIILATALTGACSAVSDPLTGSEDTADNTAPADTGRDAPAPEVTELTSGKDVVLAEFPATGDTVHDVLPDFATRQCRPGEGCFLDKCTENSQCQSGWCVEHMGEGVCTRMCQDECPAGWTCRQLAGADPDIVFVCSSNVANLCKPCQDAGSCKSPGGVDDVCVDYGQAGAFCGGACGPQTPCPWGFSCKEAQTVDGIQTTQCVNDAGVCPCTEKSTALALWTACENVNDAGACTGKRVCTDEGLDDCDAHWAVEETCNGEDDDCDGETDEPELVSGDYVNLCDDASECTEDQCDGQLGCQHLPLDMVECKDGNVCTVADHCVQGVCVGDPVVCEDENPCTDNVCTTTGGCQYPPNDEKCDDEDPCTLGDQCEDAKCQGFAMPCDCFNDEDCNALEDGDVCNGTLYMRDRLSHGYLPPHEPFECPVLAVTVGVRGLMDKGGEEALGECTVAMEEELKHVAGEA